MRAVCAALLALAVAADAEAQPGEPTWTLAAGAFLARGETRARAALAGEVEGTEVSFDGSLGMATTRTAPLFEARWRSPGRRHQLGLSHFRVARGGSAALGGEVRYAGETFAAGTQVESRFVTEVMSADYAFAVLKGPAGELTLGLGAHWLELEATLASAALGAAASERAELVAPMLRLGGAVALGARWSAQAHWQEVSTRRERYRGRLRSGAAAFHYRAFPQVEAVFGYRYFDLQLDVGRVDWIGTARILFRGPSLSLAAVF